MCLGQARALGFVGRLEHVFFLSKRVLRIWQKSSWPGHKEGFLGGHLKRLPLKKTTLLADCSFYPKSSIGCPNTNAAWWSGGLGEWAWVSVVAQSRMEHAILVFHGFPQGFSPFFNVFQIGSRFNVVPFWFRPAEVFFHKRMSSCQRQTGPFEAWNYSFSMLFWKKIEAAPSSCR